MTKTFDKFEIGELYFTGPADSGYTKVSAEEGREILTGKIVWIPSNRLGHQANPENLRKLAKSAEWQEICQPQEQKAA